MNVIRKRMEDGVTYHSRLLKGDLEGLGGLFGRGV